MARLSLGSLAYRFGLYEHLKQFIRRLNYRRNIRVHEAVICIPSIHGVSCHVSEPWMIALLSSLLQMESGVFLDIGVNVGQTLVKVKALDRSREYVGFEPNPSCVNYVKELIKVNAFENCILLPVGLNTADCVLALDLFSDDPTDTSASIVRDFRPNDPIHSQVFVPVFQFDSLNAILGEKTFGLVKIDVEGAELEVVKSILGMLRRDKPIILMEILPVYSEEIISRKNRQDELEHLFFQFDYVILRVEKTPSGDYAGLKRVERIGVHSDLAQCDYVVVPREKLAGCKELMRRSDGSLQVSVGQ